MPVIGITGGIATGKSSFCGILKPCIPSSQALWFDSDSAVRQLTASVLVHILQFSMHSGPMLTGEIVDSQGVMREWQTIPPDTPLVALFKFVCGK